MWQFVGQIKHQCNHCNAIGSDDINDFDVNCVGSDERQMGAENAYELALETECAICHSSMSFIFIAYEYPSGFLNYVESEITGATTHDEPHIEYLADYYEAEEFDLACATAAEVIREIQSKPNLIRDISPRQFEEIVAELFRHQGYQVELTKRTRDGGKDIIAISKNNFGIELKFFIECKHYAEDNKVGVDVVRALHGVKNTINGPNKIIIATTSSFTTSAVNFAKQEVTSSWDVSLADFNDIMRWIGDYGQQGFDQNCL